ncbi:uncharacterized protein LOC115938140 [Leptonychotes weddellii]|uniref:Uncharacterized protein LOC115938140 n=1 Tax=Leptonychotes weddellii TaxID=9713 RepID=A0A7F8Q7U7_LEPWE|nr:uncharacterized protein LOC115938140 [Leptonychotes weddellii]
MPGLTAASPTPSDSQEKKPLKPCCACPETKKARDAWSVRKRGGSAGTPRASPSGAFMPCLPLGSEFCCAAFLRVKGPCRLWVSCLLTEPTAQPGDMDEGLGERSD